MQHLMRLYYNGDRIEILFDEYDYCYIAINMYTTKVQKEEELSNLLSEYDTEELESLDYFGITPEEIKIKLDICEPSEKDNCNFLYLREML